MIRIGVDAWNLPGDRRGIGRYLRSILAVWAHGYADRVEVTLIVPERPAWFAAGRYRAELDGRPYGVRSRAGLRRRDFDALWFPFNGPSWDDGFGGPAVATLHDASTFVLPGFDAAARATFRAAAQRCAQILTVSTFSAGELARELELPAARIHAIPLGVAAPRPRGVASVDPFRFGRFVLFVGAADRRKNLPTALAALQLVSRADPGVRLVHIGPPTGAPRAVEGVEISSVGEVDDDTLAAFYRACSALIYPSAYEGFGLPILEAMSYGAPVVAARSPALIEAGGDAALYADTFDAAGFAAALQRILDDPAFTGELRERGLARAASMPWERTAAATLGVFEEVVARTPGPPSSKA